MNKNIIDLRELSKKLVAFTLHKFFAKISAQYNDNSLERAFNETNPVNEAGYITREFDENNIIGIKLSIIPKDKEIEINIPEDTQDEIIKEILNLKKMCFFYIQDFKAINSNLFERLSEHIPIMFTEEGCKLLMPGLDFCLGIEVFIV